LVRAQHRVPDELQWVLAAAQPADLKQAVSQDEA
jgi:hypothetical protein